jgi:pyrimidine deaminase RibD-like protein
MTDLDRQFLRRALELAAKGQALASPNPMVGAVVVDQDGKLAGEGFHTYDGVKHAEIVALDAGDDGPRPGLDSAEDGERPGAGARGPSQPLGKTALEGRHRSGPPGPRQ